MGKRIALFSEVIHLLKQENQLQTQSKKPFLILWVGGSFTSPSGAAPRNPLYLLIIKEATLLNSEVNSVPLPMYPLSRISFYLLVAE